MADLPTYDFDSDKEDEFKLTDRNAKEVANYINNMM